jgi:hypothetical protein
MVMDFITKLMRPIIEANKRLEPVNIHAKVELATKLGPWRTALKFVQVPGENSPYPCTVECRIKEGDRYQLLRNGVLDTSSVEYKDLSPPGSESGCFVATDIGPHFAAVHLG